MFLVDTNVISEIRNGPRADPGVTGFLLHAELDLFLPVQVVGEMQSGIQLLRNRGDNAQAERVEAWLAIIVERFSSRILVFDLECAVAWGKIRAGSDQNQIDRQIAAIAQVYDLTIATRNVDHYAGSGVRLFNPFQANKV